MTIRSDPKGIALRYTIRPLGDAGFWVEAAGSDSTARVCAWADACRADPLPGVTDAVPAFSTLGVFFDPARVPPDAGRAPQEAVQDWLQTTIAKAAGPASLSPRLVEIPLVYGGEHGPDLEAVAAHAGITPKEVVARHQGCEFTAGAVGFAPGFAYLEGLPQELQAPRRPTPRVAVPAGAVGIGGPYTGVYPRESPGGWNLIGRTAEEMFDAERSPQSLLAVGDRVRFRAVKALPPPKAEAPREPAHQERSLFRVVRPGVQSTLQDLGRAGYQHTGVTTAGATDRVSLQVANLLAANPPGETALECTLGGPVFECLADTGFALAGALPPGWPGPRRGTIARGETLDLSKLQGGARSYLAVPGGFTADSVLGSASTDLRAGFGGHAGRALAAGDLLYASGEPLPLTANSAWHAANPLQDTLGEARVLRVLPGPHRDLLTPDAFEWLTQVVYTVDPRSNRMGVRCQSADAAAHDARLDASVPVTHGAVQLPPDGNPIVLGPDRQTLGGYPIIACVASADLPALGQLRPGDRLRFAEVDAAGAERLRCESEQALALASVGIANALQSSP